MLLKFLIFLQFPQIFYFYNNLQSNPVILNFSMWLSSSLTSFIISTRVIYQAIQFCGGCTFLPLLIRIVCTYYFFLIRPIRCYPSSVFLKSASTCYFHLIFSLLPAGWYPTWYYCHKSLYPIRFLLYILFDILYFGCCQIKFTKLEKNYFCKISW